MKIVTSVTAFNDAVGVRLSATYSEVDDETKRIISDNNRFDSVILDNTIKEHAAALMQYATDNLPNSQEE